MASAFHLLAGKAEAHAADEYRSKPKEQHLIEMISIHSVICLSVFNAKKHVDEEYAWTSSGFSAWQDTDCIRRTGSEAPEHRPKKS